MTVNHKLRNSCPYCGYVTDRVAGISEDTMPQEGDLNLCLKCGEWAVFDDNLKLKKPTDDELVEIGLDRGCRLARLAWVKMDHPK